MVNSTEYNQRAATIYIYMPVLPLTYHQKSVTELSPVDDDMVTVEYLIYKTVASSELHDKFGRTQTIIVLDSRKQGFWHKIQIEKI